MMKRGSCFFQTGLLLLHIAHNLIHFVDRALHIMDKLLDNFLNLLRIG